MIDGARVARFRAARHDQTVVVLEGLHALKHALRFGAEILDVLCPDPAGTLELARALAPDILLVLTRLLECPVGRETFEAAAPVAPSTGVIAIARRPRLTPAQALERVDRPAVVLHEPRHLGNLGAVIRVAAALDAAGVLVHGAADPFAPSAVRGAAGLQFAVPCIRIDELDLGERRVIAFAAEGTDVASIDCVPPVALLFGSERHGLDPAAVQAADTIASIPMRAGVSSLNLATAVALGLSRAVGAGARVVRYPTATGVGAAPHADDAAGG